LAAGSSSSTWSIFWPPQRHIDLGVLSQAARA
jgi:hypothetical protein